MPLADVPELKQDFDVAATVHRVARVDAEVHHRLVHAHRIDLHRRQIVADGGVHVDARRQGRRITYEPTGKTLSQKTQKKEN